MEILKNKFFIGVVLAVIIAAIALWLKGPSKNLPQDKIVTWITNSYAQQFCTVIYPRIGNCTTLAVSDCISLATQNITACITASKDQIPNNADPATAKKVYNSMGKCFADKMHAEILQNYAVDSDECKQKLS